MLIERSPQFLLKSYERFVREAVSSPRVSRWRVDDADWNSFRSFSKVDRKLEEFVGLDEAATVNRRNFMETYIQTNQGLGMSGSHGGVLCVL